MPNPHPFFRGNDRGATPIEYALIAAGIAVVVAGTVFALGGDIAKLFGTLTDEVSEAANGGADAPGSMGFDALVAAMEVTGPDQVRQKFDTYLALNGRAVQQEHARWVMRAARQDVPWVRDHVRIVQEVLDTRGLPALDVRLPRVE